MDNNEWHDEHRALRSWRWHGVSPACSWSNLVLANVLAGGEHFPSRFAPDAADWFSRHPHRVLVGAFLQLWRLHSVGIYTATS